MIDYSQFESSSQGPCYRYSILSWCPSNVNSILYSQLIYVRVSPSSLASIPPVSGYVWCSLRRPVSPLLAAPVYTTLPVSPVDGHNGTLPRLVTTVMRKFALNWETKTFERDLSRRGFLELRFNELKTQTCCFSWCAQVYFCCNEFFGQSYGPSVVVRSTGTTSVGGGTWRNSTIV